MRNTLTVGSLTFESRNVHVIFKGKKLGEQVIRVGEQLILSKDTKLRDLVQKRPRCFASARRSTSAPPPSPSLPPPRSCRRPRRSSTRS